MATNYAGQQGTTDSNSALDVIRFIVRQELGRVRTAQPVKIVAVHGGGTAGPPTVDVMFLTNQADGLGKSTPHGTIYGIPCPRQGNASYQVIADPKVGDLGHVVVSDRDISAVTSSAAQANQGSFRRFDPSDSIYQGGVWHGPSPTQYIMFDDTGCTIIDKNGNKIVTSAGKVTITTPILYVDGQIQATGNITAGEGGGDQVDMQTHVHSGIAIGSDNTGVPVPGS